MNIELQILQPDNIEELDKLISIFETVFEMEKFQRPSHTYLLNLLKKDSFYAVVAKLDDEIIAGLTFYMLDQYYSEKPLAYIYDLAVLTTYQRNGIGLRLLEFTNEFCKQCGFEEVFVQADKVDDNAIDFYRSSNPSEEKEAVHFNYKLSTNITINE